MTVCKYCGQPESEHCIFEPKLLPDGCMCDSNTWSSDPSTIPEPCANYIGDGQEYCQTCQHDLACHKQEGKKKAIAPP